MNGSLSQFKATLRRKADRNDQANNKFGPRRNLAKDTHKSPEYNFPELTDKELNALKKNIAAQLNHERKKAAITALIVLLCIAIFAYIFFIN